MRDLQMVFEVMDHLKLQIMLISGERQKNAQRDRSQWFWNVAVLGVH